MAPRPNSATGDHTWYLWRRAGGAYPPRKIWKGKRRPLAAPWKAMAARHRLHGGLPRESSSLDRMSGKCVHLPAPAAGRPGAQCTQVSSSMDMHFYRREYRLPLPRSPKSDVDRSIAFEDRVIDCRNALPAGGADRTENLVFSDPLLLHGDEAEFAVASQ